jgi:hypothetical protein
MQAVSTACGAAAVLEIGTAGMRIVLARFTLDNPAGTASNAVLTFSGFPKSVTALSGGIAAAARIRTAAGGTDLVTDLTAGTENADILLVTTDIASGVTVTLNAANLTHAP